MKRSTGLRDYMLATGSFKQAIDGSVIRIYAGTEPASADDAIAGAVLLAVISKDGSGAGVSMSAVPASGVLTKNTSEVWIGDVVANGQAAFFRMEKPGDSSGVSTTAVRLQGSVGLINSDLNLSSLTMVVGDARRINNFVAAIPAN